MALIKVVGVSGSGKSSLVRGLQALGYDARQVSQEHSGVPDLWQRRSPPAVLIYLDASDETIRQRYPGFDMNSPYLTIERQRLHHARGHADFYLNTDSQTIASVLARVVEYLQHRDSSSKMADVI